MTAVDSTKYNKRKRSLVKKSIEMALELDKNVFLWVFDDKVNHGLVYSSKKFAKGGINAVKRVAELPRPNHMKEVYENEMYSLL